MDRKVLVTGAASTVAEGTIPALAQHFELRLLDLRRAESLVDYDWVIGSILDQGVQQEALKDVGAVMNFVIVRADSDDQQSTERVFDVYVKGLYLLLETCAPMGIHRFVQVSGTAPVIGHWNEGRDISVDSPPTTRGCYSLTKRIPGIPHRRHTGGPRAL